MADLQNFIFKIRNKIGINEVEKIRAMKINCYVWNVTTIFQKWYDKENIEDVILVSCLPARLIENENANTYTFLYHVKHYASSICLLIRFSVRIKGFRWQYWMVESMYWQCQWWLSFSSISLWNIQLCQSHLTVANGRTYISLA